ncbi:hypothetical protein Cs7R123_50880 [Catellatospora sp. TT07R-123]|uniref:hypothetical protein n=1 Tax=Catellatospora sp. TT07R-123 TaxID=2733863 RepID=UPI001B0BF8D2|nr:hypothetical protein [Catellatospora sp. TT07R-123]GHJ47746.1 hypothetical protein Cs7R123_50880 [Catellatospora sp. TT07R-123]
MSQWALAGVATAVAAAVLLVLGTVRRLRDRTDRRDGADIDDTAIDPYHAVAVAGPADGFYEPAAAALLRAGLISISPEGLVAPVAGGGEPDHPVEAAALDFFRGHDGPTGLVELTWSPEPRRRREEFLRAQEARLLAAAPGSLPRALRGAAAASGGRGTRPGPASAAAGRRRLPAPVAGGPGRTRPQPLLQRRRRRLLTAARPPHRGGGAAPP